MSLQGMLGTRPGETMTLTNPSEGIWGGYTYTTARKPSTVRYASGGAGGGLTTAARTAFGQAIDQFKPGGGYMKGIEAGLDRGRTKAVASGMSGLVSAGMSNTTQAGGLGKRYEEEIGAPTRAGAETQRMQNLASLYAALGGAEQGAYEGSAGRGLGYAQLGASQSAQAGQLGLGYAQLAARQQPNYYDGGGGGGGYNGGGGSYSIPSSMSSLGGQPSRGYSMNPYGTKQTAQYQLLQKPGQVQITDPKTEGKPVQLPDGTWVWQNAGVSR